MQAEELRAHVRSLIDERVLSATALAEKSKISRTHISNFASGRRQLSPELLQRLEQFVRPHLGGQESRSAYLEWLQRSTRDVDLRFLYEGLPTLAAAAISIDRLFVGPRLNMRDHHRLYEWNELPWEVGRPIAHIVGLAGSGKTMLIRMFIQAYSTPDSARLPIFFPLNALNRLVEQNIDSENLLDYLDVWYEQRLGRRLLPIFAKAINDGTAILLLDGLDEVHPNHYPRAKRLLKNVVDRYRGAPTFRMIVTQRQHPDLAEPISDEADVFTIEPFNITQRHILVDNLLLQLHKGSSHMQAQIDRLRDSLDREPLSRLVGNPLMLTLVTIVCLSRGIAEILSSPDKPTVLNSFFRSVMGLWSNLRSLDGVPPPLDRNFPTQVSWDVLTDLSRELLIANDTIKHKTLNYRAVLACVAESLRAHAGPSDDDLRRAQQFVDRCIASGVLQAILDDGEIRFAHEVFPQFLIGHNLRHKTPALESQLAKMVSRPSRANWGWRDIVVFALGSMGSVSPFTEGLRSNIQALLRDLSPFDDDRARNALPLGLEICLSLQENGLDHGPITQDILREAQRFFEHTDYALVTHDLQPRLLRLLDSYSTTPHVPTEPIALRGWLEARRNKSKEEWSEDVDRIWRYQTDAECFRLLFNALSKVSGDRNRHQFLRRRLVYGLQFVTKDTKRILTDLLVSASESDDPVVMAMTSYLLQEIVSKLTNDETYSKRLAYTAHERSNEIRRLTWILETMKPPQQDPTSTGLSSDNKLHIVLHQLSKLPLRRVIDTEWREVQRTAAELHYTPQQIIASLADAIASTMKNERAVALIVLGSMVAEDGLQGMVSTFYPGGENYELVTSRLIQATESSKAQFESVGACQVYDIAVWAMRAIFLGDVSTAGLPLASFRDKSGL